MRFAGRLAARNTEGPGLPVVLAVSQNKVTIYEGDRNLASFPVADVAANRASGGSFEIDFAGDLYAFEARDTVSFQYEGVPIIGSLRSSRPSGSVINRLRSVLNLDSPASSVATLEPDADTLIEVDLTTQQCPAKRLDGQPCRATILTATGYCYVHDPAPEDEDDHSKRRLDVVIRHLEEAIEQVRVGALEPDVAIAIAELATAVAVTLGAQDKAAKGSVSVGASGGPE